nr:von Willebrand factor, type A [Ipomoea batatas]
MRFKNDNHTSQVFSISLCSGTISILERSCHRLCWPLQSELTLRYDLGLAERRLRGNEKGLSDLPLLILMDLLSFIPSSEAVPINEYKPPSLDCNC